MKYDNTSDWRKGEISQVLVLPNLSYNILMPDGTVRRRTSKHVRFTSEPPMLIDDNDSTGNQTPAAPAEPWTSVLTPPGRVAARRPLPYEAIARPPLQRAVL